MGQKKHRRGLGGIRRGPEIKPRGADVNPLGGGRAWSWIRSRPLTDVAPGPFSGAAPPGRLASPARVQDLAVEFISAKALAQAALREGAALEEQGGQEYVLEEGAGEGGGGGTVGLGEARGARGEGEGAGLPDRFFRQA